MGLDMYLTKQSFIGAQYKHRNVQGKIELTEGDNNTPIKIDLKRISTITEDVAYWRKANAIHKWFVDNVQDGEDNCEEYFVSKDALKSLINACKKDVEYFETLKIKGDTYQDVDVEKLKLPTQAGFFFGGTDYTTYHFDELVETINKLEPLLKEEGSFYYQSSW